MARFRDPPFDRELIARQLEPFLRGPAARPGIRTFGAAKLDLAEAIPMWRLDADKLEGAKRISDAAIEMGRWHHQIVSPGGPVAYAVSTESTAQLTAVDRQDALAIAIDEAIKRLDASELGDGVEVRLLTIPSFHISTLWLTGHDVDDVLVLRRTTPTRAEQRLGIDDDAATLRGEHFLELLRKAGPIRGFRRSEAVPPRARG
jgi:hypothetical protein